MHPAAHAAASHFGEPAPGHLLGDLLHHVELLQQPVHVHHFQAAAGCGLEVVDVNRLLKQFDMMQQITKQMTRGRLSKMGGGGMGGRMHGFGRKKRLK